MNNIYNDVVCAYACPTTEWKPEKELWPEDKSIKFDNTEVGPDYIISGSMMTFYNVDTPEKRLKMIELFEELKTK